MRDRNLWLSSLILLIACNKASPREATTEADGIASSTEQHTTLGDISMDGSSTVFPIAEAVVKEFEKSSSAQVTIAVSGTGGGFKKFCRGEVAINNASRPINATEVELCRSEGVRYIELPIAFDGLTVVVHPENTWASSCTVSELKRLWQPEAQGKVTKWSQVSAGWPDKAIHLYGAGGESGTYDYFTAAIVGKEHVSRQDYTSSEDDNVLVQGVASDPLSLGFFGYAYFAKNQDKLKAVPIDDEKDSNGAGAIAVSIQTVSNGSYQPLSRPMFLYVSKSAAGRPEVVELVNAFMAKGPQIVEEVGCVPLPDRGYELARNRFAHNITGSMFHGGGSTIAVSMSDVMPSE